MKRKGFLKAALRGALKSLPFGNVVDEIIQNTKANIESEILEGGIETVKEPHNWVSITTQFIIIAAIVYAFITKQIDIETLVKFLD